MIGYKLRKESQAGFTLMELMIVIVIIGILAAIAFPSYQNSIRKSQRTEAKTNLLQVMSRQEQWFSENLSYTTIPADIGYTASGGAAQFKTENSHYNIWMGIQSGQSVIVATAIGSQADDSIKRYRIRSNGLKQHSLAASGDDNFVTGWDE